jgi:hypothetical protein
LELGDRVRVIRRPTQGAGNFDQYCTVQGINHQITPYGWDATLYLSPAPASYTEAEYLVVNDPVYGLIGEASGNLIPY